MNNVKKELVWLSIVGITLILFSQCSYMGVDDTNKIKNRKFNNQFESIN